MGAGFVAFEGGGDVGENVADGGVEGYSDGKGAGDVGFGDHPDVNAVGGDGEGWGFGLLEFAGDGFYGVEGVDRLDGCGEPTDGQGHRVINAWRRIQGFQSDFRHSGALSALFLMASSTPSIFFTTNP